MVSLMVVSSSCSFCASCVWNSLISCFNVELCFNSRSSCSCLNDNTANCCHTENQRKRVTWSSHQCMQHELRGTKTFLRAYMSVGTSVCAHVSEGVCTCERVVVCERERDVSAHMCLCISGGI